jgi:hypothetical protein
VEKVKPDGTLTYRPIGSPSKPDRMYSYLFQSFVVMFAKGYVDPGQHAYFPGKGVPTAINELREFLISQGENYPYMWEFDLKGAFPSVVIPEAMKLFKSIGIPPALVDVFEDISNSSVERVDKAPLDQIGLLPEPKFEKQEFLAEALPMVQPGEYDWIESQLLHAGIEWFRARKRILAEIKDPFEKYHRLWAMILIDWAEASDERRQVAFEKYQDSMMSLEYQLALEGRYDVEKLIPTFTHEEFPALVEYRKLVWERQMEDAKKKALDRERAKTDLASHGKMIAHSDQRPIEVRGFPQGLGLSPIFFNICFEAAIVRGYFSKLDAKVKVISYADDFLVFSDKPLPDIFEGSELMQTLGLVINKEKSRQIADANGWLVDGFKFLGLTFKRTVDGIINIYGTPRNGGQLFFDKLGSVEDFLFRDVELTKVAQSLFLNNITKRQLTSQEVLDFWGHGIAPFNRIPWSVINGERALVSKDLETILEDNSLINESLPGNFTASEKQVMMKHLKGQPLNAMGTRIAGLLLSRLHSVSWDTPQPKDEFGKDNSLKANPEAKGGSWIERIQNPFHSNWPKSKSSILNHKILDHRRMLSNMSIYNSTSYSSLHMLKFLGDHKSLKCYNRNKVKGIRIC